MLKQSQMLPSLRQQQSPDDSRKHVFEKNTLQNNAVSYSNPTRIQPWTHIHLENLVHLKSNIFPAFFKQQVCVVFSGRRPHESCQVSL